VLSRELVDQGDMKTAYTIVAAHAAESPANAAEAEFHAGWYALRGLNDPNMAARHFARIADLAQGRCRCRVPITWPRRRAGGPGSAKDYFTSRLRHDVLRPTRGRTRRSKTLNVAYPQPSAADRGLSPTARPSAPSSGCRRQATTAMPKRSTATSPGS
jgi:soluble lytic murein transglycosylase